MAENDIILSELQFKGIERSKVLTNTYVPLEKEPIAIKETDNTFTIVLGDGVNLIKDLPTINKADLSLYALKSELEDHTDDTDNPHSVTKAQVGLENVANTGDSATPVENGTTKFTTGGAFTELAKKQATLVDNGTNQNIKTIGGISPLGTGDIVNYNSIFATCTSAATSQNKTITLDDASYSIKNGDLLFINFANTNTFSSTSTDTIKFVIGSDNYTVRYTYSSAAAPTGVSTITYGEEKKTHYYRVDKTNKILYFIGYNADKNTEYTNEKLGQGYGTCATETAVATKAVTLSTYNLVIGGVVCVKFDNDVDKEAKLNINTKGARDIYYKGEKLKDNIIKKDDVCYFMYWDNKYHLLGIDACLNRIPEYQEGKFLQATKDSATELINLTWQTPTAVPASKKGDYFTSSEEDTIIKVQEHFNDPKYPDDYSVVELRGKYMTHWILLNHDNNYYQWWRSDVKPDRPAVKGMRIFSTQFNDETDIFDAGYEGVSYKCLGQNQWVCTDNTGAAQRLIPAYGGMIVQNDDLPTVADIESVYGGTWEQLDDGSESGVYQYHCTLHDMPTELIKSKVGDIIFSTSADTQAKVLALYEGTAWGSDDGAGVPMSTANGVYQWRRLA